MTKASRGKRVDLTRIALVALDFDGVMTDNRVLVDQSGREAVWCNRADGLGVEMLKEEGVGVIVISMEKNPVVSARCRKLRIPCIRGSRDKITALRGVMAERGLGADQIAFVGNDINDLECLRAVGVPVAPRDAVLAVRRVVRLVTKARGGGWRSPGTGGPGSGGTTSREEITKGWRRSRRRKQARNGEHERQDHQDRKPVCWRRTSVLHHRRTGHQSQR